MNLSRHLYAVGGILTILTAASFGSIHYKSVAASAPASNVFVTNPTSSPVPTQAQGTTQVAGSVGLANGSSVAINNAVALAGNTSVAVNNPVALANGTKVGINGTVSLDPSTTVNLPRSYRKPLMQDTDLGSEAGKGQYSGESGDAVVLRGGS